MSFKKRKKEMKKLIQRLLNKVVDTEGRQIRVAQRTSGGWKWATEQKNNNKNHGIPLLPKILLKTTYWHFNLCAWGKSLRMSHPEICSIKLLDEKKFFGALKLYTWKQLEGSNRAVMARDMVIVSEEAGGRFTILITSHWPPGKERTWGEQ